MAPLRAALPQAVAERLRPELAAVISVSGGVVSSIETQQDRIVALVCS